MAEHHYHETYRETPARKSGGTIAFIVGGLVVAVGLILYWVFGGVDGTTTGAGAGGSDIEINATSDSAAGAAGDGASAPVADTAEPAGDAAAGAGATADTGGDAAATAGADAQN